jgi:hypothetical protein
MQAAKEAFSEWVDLGLGAPKVAALVESMFLAASADGHVAAEEALQLAATASALTDRRFSAEEIHTLLQKFAVLLRDDGVEARTREVVAALPAGKARETALILAAAITGSDGEIRLEENSFLADFAEALEIETGRAVELIDRVQQRAYRGG